MAEPTSDKHFENKFEFPLMKLIEQRAIEKDISYLKAAEEVVPEYAIEIGYRDEEYDDFLIQKLEEERQAQKDNRPDKWA